MFDYLPSHTHWWLCVLACLWMMCALHISCLDWVRRTFIKVECVRLVPGHTRMWDIVCLKGTTELWIDWFNYVKIEPYVAYRYWHNNNKGDQNQCRWNRFLFLLFLFIVANRRHRREVDQQSLTFCFFWAKRCLSTRSAIFMGWTIGGEKTQTSYGMLRKTWFFFEMQDKKMLSLYHITWSSLEIHFFTQIFWIVRN